MFETMSRLSRGKRVGLGALTSGLVLGAIVWGLRWHQFQEAHAGSFGVEWDEAASELPALRPQPVAMKEALPLRVSPTESVGCLALGRFLAFVSELREAHDTLDGEDLAAFLGRPPIQDVERDDPTSLGVLEGVSGREIVCRFGAMQQCAEACGLETDLRAELVLTLREETRWALDEVWLDLLSLYGICDREYLALAREKYASVHAHVTQGRRDPHGSESERFLEGVLFDRAIFLMQGAWCSGHDSALLLRDLASLAEGVDPELLTSFYVQLGVLMPWSPELAVIAESLLQDPKTAWGGVEILWTALAKPGVSPEDVRRVLEARPGTTEELLRGTLHRDTVLPTAILLAECGTWGAHEILDSIQDGSDWNPSLIESLGMADPEVVQLSMLEAHAISGDAAVAAAGWKAIGHRAKDDDAAYERLLGQLGLHGSSDELGRVASALLIAGRSETLAAVEGTLLEPGAPREARLAGLGLYAALPDSDPGVLARFSDPTHEASADVRAAAAWHRIGRSRDREDAIGFAETLLDDPELEISFGAAAFAEAMLVHVDGTPEAMDRWHQLGVPAGYQLASAVGLAGITPLFEDLGDPRFGLSGGKTRALAEALQSTHLEQQSASKAFHSELYSDLEQVFAK